MKKENYKLKVTFFFGLIILYAIVCAFISNVAALFAVILGMITFSWWAFTIGSRSLFFYFAPYILYAVVALSFVYFLSNNTKDGKDVAKILFLLFLIVGILAFLFEYFGFTPKCSHCKKRTGMKKLDESDFSSYDRMGTKSYDVRNKSGEKIGSYDAPVSQTVFHYTGHYKCAYCGGLSNIREARVYDND